MLRQTDCDDADQNVLDVKELPSGPIISYYVLSNHLNGNFDKYINGGTVRSSGISLIFQMLRCSKRGLRWDKVR